MIDVVITVAIGMQVCLCTAWLILGKELRKEERSLENDRLDI